MNDARAIVGVGIVMIFLAVLASVFLAAFVLYYQIRHNKSVIPTKPLAKSLRVSVLIGFLMSLILIVSSVAGALLWQIFGNPSPMGGSSFYEYALSLGPTALLFWIDFSLTLFIVAQISTFQIGNLKKTTLALFLVGTLNILTASLMIIYGTRLTLSGLFDLNYDVLAMGVTMQAERFLFFVFNPSSAFGALSDTGGNVFSILGMLSPFLILIAVILAPISLLSNYNE